jgi:hypothetical protein
MRRRSRASRTATARSPSPIKDTQQGLHRLEVPGLDDGEARRHLRNSFRNGEPGIGELFLDGVDDHCQVHLHGPVVDRDSVTAVAGQCRHQLCVGRSVRLDPGLLEGV